MNQKIRLLLSRDDYYHQRGYWVVATALRQAGMEVILGGIQTPSQIVQTAVQEGVDIIGYRIMDAEPKILIPELFGRMREKGIGDLPVVVGGIIPEKDEMFLRKEGVREIFHPFTPLEEVVKRVKAAALTGSLKRAPK